MTEVNVCVLLLYDKQEDFCILCDNTNPEEWRIALSIVAHCKVVRLRPQDLHNVLIELCLFFLQRERQRMCSGESLRCALRAAAAV